MNQSATSVRNHCLSRVRTSVAIDVPLGPATYARMFPELPSFHADEQFLHALGRAGGVCDCGDPDDSPDSLAMQPLAGPSSVNFWPTILRLTGPFCEAIPIQRNCAMRAARNSTSNACTAMDRPGIPSSTSVTIRRSFCSVRTAQTFNEMQRASQLSATHATIPTCCCRNCISPCLRLTTHSSMKRGAVE